MKLKIYLKEIFLIVFSFIFMLPIIFVLINSVKTNVSIGDDFFALPMKESFAGINNYIKGITFGNYPFISAFVNSVVITILSTTLIIISTLMASWYIIRVNDKFSKIMYYLYLFSMVVPFQMIMFTLSKTADTLKLNTPFTIPFVYLGLGTGLGVFMFCGFLKSVPHEIEEAAIIDGCNPVQIFIHIIMPICKPVIISVAILEIMWVWNDYLLPYLVLDRTKYMTIPVHIEYLQGSFGQVDLGALMAIIVMCLIPIIIIYIKWQKYIIKGIVDGAVK